MSVRPRRLLTGPVALAAALALAACGRGGPPERAGPPTPQPEPTTDAGAPVLAAALNARAAIAAGDAVAAFNDVNLGLGYAVRLPGADSALYPPQAAPPGYQDHSGGNGSAAGARGAGGRHRRGGGSSAAAPESPAAEPAAPAPTSVAQAGAPHAGHGGHRGRHAQGGAQGSGAVAQAHQGGQAGPDTLSSFDAQVRLISAKAKLQNRDEAGADADLEVVEAAVHPQLTPVYLPLIRADQSLTLAAAAGASGRLGELRTQLATAQAALASYQGGPHAAQAKALAATIDAATRRPGGPAALAPAEIALWAGVVGAWTGLAT